MLNETAQNANAFASTFAIRTSQDTRLKLQKSLQAIAQGHSVNGQIQHDQEEGRTHNMNCDKNQIQNTVFRA